MVVVAAAANSALLCSNSTDATSPKKRKPAPLQALRDRKKFRMTASPAEPVGGDVWLMMGTAKSRRRIEEEGEEEEAFLSPSPLCSHSFSLSPFSAATTSTWLPPGGGGEKGGDIGLGSEGEEKERGGGGRFSWESCWGRKTTLVTCANTRPVNGEKPFRMGPPFYLSGAKHRGN